MTKQEITDILVEEVAAEMKTSSKAISLTDDFGTLGLDSLSAVYVIYQVEKRLQRELNPAVFWDYPSIELLAEHLHKTSNHG